MGDIVGAFIGADAQKSAAEDSANAQRYAADKAAAAAQFKPYNVRTGLGSSTFDTSTGTASYTLDPRLKALQDQLFSLGGGALPGSTDTTQAAKTLFGKYQDMLAPSRERQFADLQNSQFGRGTLGLMTGATTAGAGGQGDTNPALRAYLDSINQQDQGLALQADQTARSYMDQDIARANGLFNTGMGLETPGLQSLDYGINIGSKQASAGANVGQSLLQGGISAAKTSQAGQQNYISQIMSGLNGFNSTSTGSPAPWSSQGLFNSFKNWGSGGPDGTYNGETPMVNASGNWEF